MSEEKNKFTLTVGADPEFFVLDGEGKDAKPIMACGRFGGTKGAPQLLSDEGGFLEDGTAIEFNLTTSQTLADTQAKIFRLISQFEKARNCHISAYSSASWPMAELRQHPQAMQIGCAPDLYAYGLRTMPSVSSFKAKRFAGGHIHIGIDPWPTGLDKITIVRFLDAGCLAPIQLWLHDSSRYPHYGYPGLYRETSYGVEWRSPDNLWCNPKFIERVASGQSKKSVMYLIQYFDRYMRLLMNVLNKDGHGARANHIINGVIDEVSLVTALATSSSRRIPSQTNSLRSFGAQVEDCLLRAHRDGDYQGLQPTT